MNLFDRAVSFFSPKAAYSRMRYRKALDVATRRYDAAGGGRRTDGWQTEHTSANNETAMSLPKLRARSRELVRNNPYAKRAIQNMTTNLVGTGITPTPKLDKTKSKQSEKIKKEWQDWAGSTECDYNAQFNFYGLQRLAIRSIVESGEVLIRIHKAAKGSRVPIKLQVLEADHLDSGKDLHLNTGEPFTIQGVQFDAKGKRSGYWIFPQHPGDSFNLNSVLIPADEIMHIYYVERPGQVRGVPFGASAMLRLRDFDDYEDAQLMRQKVAACFSVFITDPTEETGNNREPIVDRLEPGLIEELAPGKTVSFATPPPAEGYDEYSRTVLRAIAAGYGTTYEAMTGDLSNVNFSAGRLGFLEFQRLITELQSFMLIPMLCDRTWVEFLKAAAIAGTLPTALSNTAATWTLPAREMIDPTKEIKALNDTVRAGFDSWQNAVRQLGKDPEVVMQQMKEDSDKFDKMGLFPTSDSRFDVNRTINAGAGANGNAPTDDKEDKEDQPEEDKTPAQEKGGSKNKK